MRIEDLKKAFWGRLEIRITEYGYSSLRNFCQTYNLNYQVIAAARSKMEFPSMEDVIHFSEYLDVDINALIYGTGFEEIFEEREERREVTVNTMRKYRRIIDALKDADPIRIAAVEMIFGLYKEHR